MKFIGPTFWKSPSGKFRAILLPVIVICLAAAPAILHNASSFAAPPALQEPSPPRNIPASNQKLPTKKIQQEIIEKNDRIRKLQEGIIEHKIKILESKDEERTLLGELETIEKELQTLVKMLADLRSESDKQELLLAESQKNLHQVLQDKKAHQVHVKNRLAAYYRMGSVGLMNVLFSTESLPELLEFNEYFNIMVQHDQALIQQYLRKIQEANSTQEEYAREQLRLLKLTEEVKAKENQLNQVQQEKNILLQQVNTEQHLYEQAVNEIEEAASDLATTLHRLELAAAQPPPPQIQGPSTQSMPKVNGAKEQPMELDGFPAQKGLLDPPVQGSLINRFGQHIIGKFETSTTSQGIDIKVRKGEEIRAVYDGKIIHAGYLRGYGNLMIIDHGHQYFSLVARAADFYKNEGTSVAKGEVIGMTGDGDPMYGEGLHFEIRKGANPEDPLLWLKKNAFASGPTAPAPQTN
jgi:septal ring factor EnvC (AmiA/AmiB activator)